MEHIGDEMMPQDERGLVTSILSHKYPSGTTLCSVMGLVTSRVLNHLKYVRLNVQKQNGSQAGSAVLYCVDEVLRRHAEPFTADLRNGIQGVVLGSQKERQPNESFIANGGDLHRYAIFRGSKIGGDKRKRKVHGRNWPIGFRDKLPDWYGN
jgi:hypothetical protein